MLGKLGDSNFSDAEFNRDGASRMSLLGLLLDKCSHLRGAGVAMMQAANLRHRNDLTLTWRLNVPWRRRIAIQRPMRAHLVIVIEIQSEHALEMDFVQYNQVVQTFAADGTNDSFSLRLLILMGEIDVNGWRLQTTL